MSAVALAQQLPIQVDGQVVRRRWEVDLAAAARASGLKPARLLREAGEMADHFPRWVLTVADGRRLVRCGRCDGLLVFERGLRCVQCSKEAAVGASRAAWFGLLPPIGLDGLPKVARAVATRPVPHHPTGERAGLGRYLLVPLIASYPATFPGAPVDVFYLPELGQLCPTEQVSHHVHMLGGGRMCLYAAGEWSPQSSAREVLQQRAYAHVVKLLNTADGRTTAFAKVS